MMQAFRVIGSIGQWLFPLQSEPVADSGQKDEVKTRQGMDRANIGIPYVKTGMRMHIVEPDISLVGRVLAGVTDKEGNPDVELAQALTNIPLSSLDEDQCGHTRYRPALWVPQAIKIVFYPPLTDENIPLESKEISEFIYGKSGLRDLILQEYGTQRKAG